MADEDQNRNPYPVQQELANNQAGTDIPGGTAPRWRRAAAQAVAARCPPSPTATVASASSLVATIRPFILFEVDGATMEDIGERHNRFVRFVVGGEAVRARDAAAEEHRRAKRIEEMEKRLNALQAQIHLVYGYLDVAETGRDGQTAGA